MKLFFNMIALLFLFNIMACKVHNKVKQVSQSTPIISYRKAKGRCTPCPQFTIDILANRTAIYEGKANVPILGKQVITLSKKKFRQIITQFEQSNFTNFEKLYLSRMRDAPRMVVLFQGHEVSTQKSVCPESLMQLITLIESIKPL